jgi:hypothetical protein
VLFAAGFCSGIGSHEAQHLLFQLRNSVLLIGHAILRNSVFGNLLSLSHPAVYENCSKQDITQSIRVF